MSDVLKPTSGHPVDLSWSYYRAADPTIHGDYPLFRRQKTWLTDRWDPTLRSWVRVPGEPLTRDILFGGMAYDPVSVEEAHRITSPPGTPSSGTPE
jgi:hypothetical protein